MRKPAPHRLDGHITVQDCTVCGRTCNVDTFRLHWEQRPASTCIELARVAAEILTVASRDCRDWRRWVRAATRHLWWILWRTPLRDVDDALASATARFLRKHARDNDIAAMCASLPTHGPNAGEMARFPSRFQSRAFHQRRSPPPQACWIRCERHRAWCAVGLRKVDPVHGLDRSLTKRRVMGLRLIAEQSRSCEEFHARRTQSHIPHTTRFGDSHNMSFAPAKRGRWTREEQQRTARPGRQVGYEAAIWGTLAPALAPWGKIAAQTLRGPK
jgi:hypothetical protein